MAKKSKPFSTKNLFVVYYAVIGSRCTGSYLVKAKDKTTANKLVRKLDRDYVRLKAHTLKEDGCDLEEYKGCGIPRMNHCSSIESGT